MSASTNSTLAERQNGRVRVAVRQERKDGLRLALRLRVVVLVLVACYLLSFGPGWDQFINISAILGLCLTGWAQYRVAGTRFDRPISMALFPAADALLVAYAVFAGIELEGELPRTVMDEDRSITWFILLLTMQALAYRPWLAVWSGVVTAIVWIGLMFWMLDYPGAHGWMRLDAISRSADPVQFLMAAYYDPLFIHAEVWIREALIVILCGVILAVGVHRSQGMMSRALQAERSRANLARYFSPSMVDQLAAGDQPFETAREQDIGVLFADMVGFTRFAESSAPTEVIDFLREFHGRLARVIFEHGGTLDKFVGDCVMATFGTPRPGEDDARRTVACAIAIAQSVETWNQEREARGEWKVEVGVGAHYGRVVLGDIGDQRRLEFAVLGDTVNVASRLEALTRELSCSILISDDLVSAARSEAGPLGDLLGSFWPLEPQRLRNREERVPVWMFAAPSARSFPAAEDARPVRQASRAAAFA